jgi:hypothetical protein
LLKAQSLLFHVACQRLHNAPNLITSLIPLRPALIAPITLSVGVF